MNRKFQFFFLNKLFFYQKYEMVQRLRNVSSKIEIVVDVPSCIYEFKFILLNTRCKVDKTKSIVRKKKNTSSSHHGMMEIISLNGINSISTKVK